MPYATTSDLTIRFGDDELLALAPDEAGTAIEQATVDAALTDADAKINSYLATRYSVPVTGSELLKLVACDLVRYNLYDSDAPETVETRYKQQISWLKDIAAGRATLGVKNTEAAITGAVVVTRTRSNRSFTRESLSGF